MKYSYHIPASTYTRHSQYTPTYHTPTNYASSHYTPSYTSPSKYTPTQYSGTHHTPSYYTPSYTSSSSYIPSRYSSTRLTQAREDPAPVRPITPVKRTVHFPNDIIFQDVVRRGELGQIGRFIRTRKVRVDTLFPSGMAALHEAVLTGNLDVVKLLVKYGADINQRDEDGWTPLHMACSDGFPEIASYLLSLGANKEAENESGEKPADLIDPDCTELSKLFEAGCIASN
ncbi:protein phosphatase 1 regulatory subunit 27 [Festucalex cinctus]